MTDEEFKHDYDEIEHLIKRDIKSDAGTRCVALATLLLARVIFEKGTVETG